MMQGLSESEKLLRLLRNSWRPFLCGPLGSITLPWKFLPLPYDNKCHAFLLKDCSIHSGCQIMAPYRVFIAFLYLYLLTHVSEHPLFTERKAHVNIFGFLCKIKHDYEMHVHLHDHTIILSDKPVI
jgi:hypothetical protein